MDATLNIMVNGEPRQVALGETVGSLIRGLNLKACAAEVNRRLVPRKEQDQRVLANGDVVELVTLVGGG